MTLDQLWAGWRASYIDERRHQPAPVRRRLPVLPARDGEDPDERSSLARNDHVFAVMNAYPYTSGHLMVAPLRHEGTLAGSVDDEATALMAHDPGRDGGASTARTTPTASTWASTSGAPRGAGIPGTCTCTSLPRWNGDTNFMTTVAEARVLPEPLTGATRS